MWRLLDVLHKLIHSPEVCAVNSLIITYFASGNEFNNKSFNLILACYQQNPENRGLQITFFPEHRWGAILFRILFSKNIAA